MHLTPTPQDLKEMIDKANCAPIMVRLAWHDAGTFDVSKADKPFPARGGANGSIRFDPELAHGQSVSQSVSQSRAIHTHDRMAHGSVSSVNCGARVG